MNIDCQWIDKNLEALFSGTLSREDQVHAQQHIENCGLCGKEVAALNAVDPLVKRYFQSQLNRVQQGSSSTVAKGRLVLVSSAALIAVCLIIFATLRTSHSYSVNPSQGSAQIASSPQPVDIAPSVKSSDGNTTGERAKPVESAPDAVAPTGHSIATPDNNAPDFVVIDPAGYSRTLADYRGYVFVLGVLRADQLDATSDFERLYKEFGSNRKLRFLGVSPDRQIRNTTFPIAYNQGSKLFGALPGDFVLLDEAGSIQLRGSLVKDFDKLETSLQQK
jgi:hypothetical protein